MLGMSYAWFWAFGAACSAVPSAPVQDPPPEASPPPSLEAFEGHWKITWTRPGSWWPKEFTGPLVVRQLDEAWTASLSFDQSGGSFVLSAMQVVDDRLELTFAVEQDTFELTLARSGEGLIGEASWVGSIDASPVKGMPITPVPADLPGLALRPVRTSLPAQTSALLPREADPWSTTPRPVLSGDGRRVWLVGGSPRAKLWTGDTADLAQLKRIADAPSHQGWSDSDPTGETLYFEAKSGLVAISRDGTWSKVAGELGDILWVEPRWEDGRLLVAATRDGLRVLDLSLKDGTFTEVFAHPTADDVVLDPSGEPRFLLERETKHSGKGVSLDLVTVLGPDAQVLGDIVRQPAWVGHKLPVPHVGRGPVHLLSGGDLVTLGTLWKRGVRPERPSPGQWADATSLLVDPETGVLDAVGWSAERLHWDARTADGQELAWLETQLGADVSVQQRVASDRRWLVASWSGSIPLQHWLFDRDERTLALLVAPGTPPEQKWQPVEPLMLRSRNDHPLAAYLTRPTGAGPWPLVVEVHGGPWSGRHRWKLDASAQQWAERGYATLTVNFRGTHGFGWNLMESSEFGDDSMIHDVEDAILWAIEQGVADPARIAMVGVSYGGYAALRFATSERPLLKCAVGGLARGNLTVPGGGLNIYAVKDPAWREAHSPDRFTSRLAAPVLVWTGGRDGENADQIQDFVSRAQADGKAVTWVRFPWEGHGLKNAANRAAMDVIIDRFLGACLGGPAWDFPEDFVEAELEVRAGAEHVPGLADHVR
jgi:dienelactone hydrolase